MKILSKNYQKLLVTAKKKKKFKFFCGYARFSAEIVSLNGK
jgi:hypothetical protein